MGCLVASPQLLHSKAGKMLSSQGRNSKTTLWGGLGGVTSGTMLRGHLETCWCAAPATFCSTGPINWAFDVSVPVHSQLHFWWIRFCILILHPGGVHGSLSLFHINWAVGRGRPWQATSVERGGSICVFCRSWHKGSKPDRVIANGFISRRHHVKIGGDRGRVCSFPRVMAWVALPPDHGKSSVPLLGSEQGCNM